MHGITIFFDGTYTPLQRAMYAGLHRFGWSIATSWILLSCAMGYAGPLKKILSARVFVPLSRLTYCAYLMNGLTELYLAGTIRSPKYMSTVNLVCTLFLFTYKHNYDHIWINYLNKWIFPVGRSHFAYDTHLPRSHGAVFDIRITHPWHREDLLAKGPRKAEQTEKLVANELNDNDQQLGEPRKCVAITRNGWKEPPIGPNCHRISSTFRFSSNRIMCH